MAAIDELDAFQDLDIIDPLYDLVSHQYLIIADKFKEYYLPYLLSSFSNGNSTIIYTRTVDETESLTTLLRDFSPIPLHRELCLSTRLAAVAAFQNESGSLLITTQSGLKDLDAPYADLVINYTLPLSPNPKRYTARLDDIARVRRDGQVLSIVTQYDIEIWDRIDREKRFEELTVSKEEVDQWHVQRTLAFYARICGQSEGKSTGRDLKRHEVGMHQDGNDSLSSTVTR